MTSTSTEKYLAQHTPAKRFLEPSCDQVLGVVCFRRCIATTDKHKDCCAIFTGCCAVTPLTNITPVSLWYQSYLNVIFHRTNFAFYGHALMMPLVVLFLLAWADRFRFDETTEWGQWINANFVLTLAFLIWYTIWGACYKIWFLGPCSVPILAVCYFGGHFYNERAASTLHPMVLSGICAFLQSFTHLFEDLPPRMSGSLAWTLKTDFACRDVSNCGEVTCRVLRLFFTFFISGPIDEWTASPRLLPLFWSLWPIKTLMNWCGCSCCGIKEELDEKFKLFAAALEEFPRVEVALDDNGKPVAEPLEVKLHACGECCDRSARCLCCEPTPTPPLKISNPALDYVGYGGGSFMLVDDDVSCCDALCGNYTANQIKLSPEAGMLQTWRVCETDPRDPVVGVWNHEPFKNECLHQASRSPAAAPAAGQGAAATAAHPLTAQPDEQPPSATPNEVAVPEDNN